MSSPKITRRVVTPAELEDLYRGSTRIAPGFWVDRHGALHVSITELLDLVGLEDTVENRDQCLATVVDIMKANGADEVIQTDLAPAPPSRGVH